MKTDEPAGALTVAGQWRNFTAFPSILAIAELNATAHKGAVWMPWNNFPRYELL